MEAMTDTPDPSPTRGTRTREKTRRRSLRRGILIGLAVVVLALAAVIAVGAVAATKAFAVRDTLIPAVPLASGLPAKIIAGDTAGATADAEELKRKASAAVEETRSLSWQIAEAIPFAAPNFAAVRSVAESMDKVADFALASIPSLDIAALRPVDGRVDLEAVHRLIGIVTEGASVFDQINRRVDEMERTLLLPQVESALGRLDDAVSGVDDALGSLEPVLRVLPAALGEGQPRTYLLMFQGNSELRASGGNPAALALVTATDGRIEMTAQATSVQFDNAREESIAPLDAETEHIYSDIIGRWIPNMTATPHFPTTVEIMRAWWSDEGLPPFDDVVSVDPIALSYMLKSTGPVQLATGETLTSENAASLLLNEVYFRYGEHTDQTPQDAFFAAAAAQIFNTLTSGVDNPLGLLQAVQTAADEGRVKLWSSNPEISTLIAGSKLAGTLPEANAEQTIAGVFFNDTTGAKTDYYADAAITASTDMCTTTGAPSFTQTITFADNITFEQAASLPYFITGPHYPAGTIATDVVVYSPVGAVIESWKVDGAAHRLVAEGTHMGRDVVRINVVTTPQTSATISVTMRGAEGVSASEYGAFDVWTTPMVRETPVTIDAPGCQ